MLWFNKIKSPSGAAKYFTPEGRDYEVDDERLYAFFGGKGSERLGLKEFDIDQLKLLLEGSHPLDGTKLTAGARRETNRHGYEVVFDAPKDVSMLWAFGDRRIPGAMELAMRETLAVIEEDAKARVRIGKADHDRVTGNITYAAVLHTLAREENQNVDMHLHYHVLLPNATYDPVEKKWKALQLQAFDENGTKLDRPRYLEIYHAQLRNQLHRLGYETETTKDAFRIVGIDDESRSQFSQRHNRVKAEEQRIEKEIREKRNNPDYTLSDKQKSKLAAIYREPKQPGRSMDSLREHWADRITPKQLSQLTDLIAKADMPLAVADRSAEAATYALEHTTTRESRPDQRKVILEALKFGRGNVTYQGILKELSRPGIHRRAIGDHVEVTTRKVVAEERLIVSVAKEGRGRCKPFGNNQARTFPESTGPINPDLKRLAAQTKLPLAEVQRYASFFDFTPTSGQLLAARHVMTSPDKVIMWVGRPGVGKSTALKAVKRMGVPMQVVAPTVGASRDGDLKQDFPDVDTVAAFLRDEEKHKALKGGLLVIDEISMLGTRDFARVSQLADTHGFRVLVVGDDKQHLAPVRGDVLGLLREKAGVPVVEMSEILRQKGRYREATEAASKHDVLAALDVIDAQGWVKEGKAEDMIGLAADVYMECLHGGQSAVICSPTHKQGEKIVEAVRERLRKEGLLGEERECKQLVPLHYTEPQLAEAKKHPEPGIVYQRYDAYTPQTIKLAVGDLIQLTGGGKGTDGKKLENGSVFRIDGFTENGDIIGTSAGDDKTQRIIDAGFGKLRHAYYATSQGVQSKTRDVTIMPLTSDAYPAMGARQFNVDLSRGRHKAVILTDSRDMLREQIQRNDSRDHALDLVREERKGIRKRLRKHLQFIRNAVTVAKEMVLGKSNDLEVALGR